MAAPTDLDGVRFDFVAAQGFSYDFGVTILDANGDPVNLGDQLLELGVRTGPKDPIVLLLTPTSGASFLEVDSPSTGHMKVHFDGVDTVSLPAPKGYSYDLRLNGYRKMWGTMTLRPGVTINV